MKVDQIPKGHVPKIMGCVFLEEHTPAGELEALESWENSYGTPWDPKNAKKKE